MSARVLVGYDGSPQADQAVEWAADAATARNADLEVLTCWTLPTTEVGVGSGPAYDTQLLDAMRRESEDILQRGKELAARRAPGVTVTGDLAVGPPAAVLVDRAKEGIDLVVLGTHGSGGFAGLLLGSVSRQVATHVECPAVVVRQPADPESDAVVVGVDGSPSSVNALSFAFETASRRGLRVRILHTWEIPPIGAVTGVPTFSAPELLEDLSDAEMRTIAEELAGHRENYPDVDVEVEVVRGSPVKALRERSEHAAMIVLGSRGRGGFVGLLLGSVSHSVVHHAQCTVAIVR